MDREAYARLEAMPSLIDHMSSYADVAPSDRRPQPHLRPDDLAIRSQLPNTNGPRIAICADFVDALRHWPVHRWRTVARVLHDAGAQVVGIGVQDRLGFGVDAVGRLSMREDGGAARQLRPVRRQQLGAVPLRAGSLGAVRSNT